MNAASFSRHEETVVFSAAREFARTAAGSWKVAKTMARTGSGSTIVIVEDRMADRDGAWGITWTTLMTRSERTDLVGATVHVSNAVPLSRALRHVALHELAHAVGADHSHDRRDVTYAYVEEAYRTYTKSEARGVRRVSGRACK